MSTRALLWLFWACAVIATGLLTWRFADGLRAWGRALWL